MDPVVGATATIEQPQMDSQTAQADGIETPQEAIPAKNVGADGTEQVVSDNGGSDEQITISREAYDNLLKRLAGGQVTPTTLLPQEVPPQSQTQTLEPPASFFELDESTFNQALRDPQTFSNVMNESLVGAVTNMLALYEKRNQRNIQNEIFNVLASRELINDYPELKERGDVVLWALNQVRSENPGIGRDAMLSKTHEFIKKNIGLARKIESTKHDHIPKEKVPGAGTSARAKGGTTATSKANRSATGGPVSERSRLGLA